MLGEKPICLECRHRMELKMAVSGQAQRGNGHSIELIGPVRQEVISSVCKIGPVPITSNPCVIECSEFEPAAVKPQLRKPQLAGVEN